MVTVSHRNEKNHFFRFSWESIFVLLSLCIYAGCIVLTLIPGINTRTIVLFFFEGSMGLYLLLMTSALIINIFLSAVQGKSRHRKTITGLI